MDESQELDCAALVIAARHGDQVAWQELFARFMPLLRRIAYQHRLSSEEAADVMQNTWLRCLQRVGQLKDDEKFGGWISVICRRECLALVNRRRRETSLEQVAEPALELAGPHLEDPCSAAIRLDEKTRLQQAITRLPPRQRLVVQGLIDLDEHGYAEIARQLDIPIGSIGPTRKRALSRLRAELGSGRRDAESQVCSA